MKMLYDSDNFVVVHLVANDPILQSDQLSFPPRNVFELVDKRTNKEVLLDGDWALAFENVIAEWHRLADLQAAPTQEEVEETLESYCALAQIPLVIH